MKVMYIFGLNTSLRKNFQIFSGICNIFNSSIKLLLQKFDQDKDNRVSYIYRVALLYSFSSISPSLSLSFLFSHSLSLSFILPTVFLPIRFNFGLRLYQNFTNNLLNFYWIFHQNFTKSFNRNPIERLIFVWDKYL